ncbi:hypothetical protein R6258_03975 [Halomonas sp. HP20-15]|uniref:hypothetical protein n=1 Tax=Halomonas sp. HP20-15 TaxID=3085901 RepID=UPI002980A3C8|nr:hypothetical protein [Halomonas sp. HP20-15]MDW5376070.1 hypothetical protein [Halomonas sp. HP20-15]
MPRYASTIHTAGWLIALLIALTLSGCASNPGPPKTVRQALYGLGERAAETALAAPVWQVPDGERVLLLAPAEIDAALSIEPAQFGETLTRALLAVNSGPQVLDWTPDRATREAPDNQWLLESRLIAEGPALTLSDRRLLPYRLELALRRPGNAEPRWQQTLTGALDASAL